MRTRIDISERSFRHALKYMGFHPDETMVISGPVIIKAKDVSCGSRLCFLAKLMKMTQPVTASEIIASQKTGNAFWKHDIHGTPRSCQA